MTTGGNTTKADGYAKITLLQALPFLTVSSYNSTQATFKADHRPCITYKDRMVYR